MCDTSWNNNANQFPRLLAEIMATQDHLDMAALAESMDLSIEEVSELFDRAQETWEQIKSSRYAQAVRQRPPRSKETEMVIGKLWWNADHLAEAQQWQMEYLAKGALLVELKPERDRPIVAVLITLHKERAKEIFGYEPEEEEWLDISEMAEQAAALGFNSPEEMVLHQVWLEKHGTPEYRAWVVQILAGA